MLNTKTILTGCAVAIASFAIAPHVSAALPVGFIETPLNIPFTQPVGVVFSPSGRMFVWEKIGKVWIVENGVKGETPLIDLTQEVGNWRDFGLLGFALDPDYEANGRFYLSYVVDYHHAKYFGTPTYNPAIDENFIDTIARVTRYTATSANGFRTADPASRTVLIGESLTTGIPILHQSHGPGTLTFGNDGTLLVATGDGGSFSVADDGGPNEGSSNTGLIDGIITPDQDVGAYRSQQVDSLSGKILRIDPNTGNGVATNPFYDAAQPRAPRSRVYALGLRNPFRFAVKPDPHGLRHAGPGTLTIGDNGWNVWEELNVVKAGGENFGWPLFEGHDPQPLYQAQNTLNPAAPNPLAGGSCPPFVPFSALCVQDAQGTPSFPNPCNPSVQLPGTLRRFDHTRAAIEWAHDGGPARVPTFASGNPVSIIMGTPGCPVLGNTFGGNSSMGGAWYPATGVYPSAYLGTYFHADFVGGWIKSMVFDVNDNLVSVREFALNGSFPGIVSLAVNPADSLLYFIKFDFGGGAEIYKLEYVSNLPPVVSARVVGNNYGPSPLAVQFSTAGSFDPEGQPLSYEWDFGDISAKSSEANPLHVYAASGNGPQRFDAVVRISDPGGLERTVSLIVSVNNTPPAVTVTSPVDGALFPPNASSVVPMTSTIVDNEHSPTELACRWNVLLHHNAHVHPEPEITDCTSSAIISGAHGANDEVFYFEFVHTVTDAHGLSTSTSHSIFPDLPECQGDINRDGATDTRDLVRLLGTFGQSGSLGLAGDLNFDGSVSVFDLVIFLGGFGCPVAP